MSQAVASSSLTDRLFHVLCACCLALPLGCGLWSVGTILLRGSSGWSSLPFALLRRQMEIVGVAAALAVPLGIGVAVYLEHVAHRGVFAAIARRSIALLAAVPSVLYALFGVTLLVVCLDVRSKFVTLACCLALFLFPIVVERTRAALHTVSPLVHEASLALGADPHRAIWHVILPLAKPALASEMLLVLARALGTVAPLLVVDVFTAKPDNKIASLFPLPEQIFRSGTNPDVWHQQMAASCVLVLVGVLFVLQIVAHLLTQRRSKGLSERGAA